MAPGTQTATTSSITSPARCVSATACRDAFRRAASATFAWRAIRPAAGDAGNRAAGTIVQMKTTVPYIDKRDQRRARGRRRRRRVDRGAAHAGAARACATAAARWRSRTMRILHARRRRSGAREGGAAATAARRSARQLAACRRGERHHRAAVDRCEAGAVDRAASTLVEDYLRAFVDADRVARRRRSALRSRRRVHRGRARLARGRERRRGRGARHARSIPASADRRARRRRLGLWTSAAAVGPVRRRLRRARRGPHSPSEHRIRWRNSPGALATGRFLVYSGQHQITLTFVGAE